MSTFVNGLLQKFSLLVASPNAATWHSKPCNNVFNARLPVDIPGDAQLCDSYVISTKIKRIRSVKRRIITFTLRDMSVIKPQVTHFAIVGTRSRWLTCCEMGLLRGENKMKAIILATAMSEPCLRNAVLNKLIYLPTYVRCQPKSCAWQEK